MAGAVGASVLLLGSLATRVAPDDDQASPTSTTVKLTGEAKELVALLERDREATFHAKYDVTSTDLPGAAVTFETWRKPPRSRSDIDVTRTDGVVRTRQIRSDDSVVACQQAGSSPWRCSRKAEAEGSTDPFEKTVSDEVARAQSVTARDETIDDRRVRCFMLRREGITSEYCATAEGVPVRVEAGGTKLRLVLVDDRVDDVFEPPAAVE